MMSEETCEYCGVHGGGHGSKCRLKMKPFKLSDKINKDYEDDIKVKDIKEFIKLVNEEDNDFYDDYIRDEDLEKEEIVEVCFKYFKEKINHIAGDDLI